MNRKDIRPHQIETYAYNMLPRKEHLLVPERPVVYLNDHLFLENWYYMGQYLERMALLNQYRSDLL